MSNRSIFLQHLAQTSPSPLGLEITKAEGSLLIDKEGKSYIDLICGIGPSVLGHNHSAIINAIKTQADQYLHTMVYGEFVLSVQTEYVQLLLQQLPASFSNVYLLSTGTEAVEAAMKIAKRSTGRQEIISMKNAYHGSTQGSMSLMSDTYFTEAYEPLLPAIRHIGFNALDDLHVITEQTAAVITEPVQAESGITSPKEGYLQKLRERCNEVGALLIFDEIQTGFGRTGKLFAFQKYGVTPDLLILAKAMGAGMPISALVGSKEILSNFSVNPVLGHITTYGGHPLSCVAASAGLRTILEEELIEKVNRKMKIFSDGLNHPAIREVRQNGFWFAVDLGSHEKVLKTVQNGLKNGILVDWFLFNDRSIRIAPALNIPDDIAEDGLNRLMLSIDQSV